VILLLVAVAGVGIWLHWRHNPPPALKQSNPVPLSIRQSVSFPVYYPDPKKLPNGYSLNTGSFSSPVKNGVRYSVNYDNHKKIVFSVQAKPSDNELQTFNSSFIPLRIDYQTSVGQAEIGAYHTQTLVSLPISNGPWVVITAPQDISQDELKAVLRSLRQ
jgi:hypothetical protein